MATTVILNGNSYNDGSSPPGNMGNGGHRQNFLLALRDFLIEAGKAPNDISTSSVTIGTDTKNFTLTSKRPFAVGQYVMIGQTSNASNNMYGQVTSYDVSSGLLIVNVELVSGSGTHADWSISMSGPKGPASITLPVAISNGGTGATTPAGARAALGVGENANAIEKGTFPDGTPAIYGEARNLLINPEFLFASDGSFILPTNHQYFADQWNWKQNDDGGSSTSGFATEVLAWDEGAGVNEGSLNQLDVTINGGITGGGGDEYIAIQQSLDRATRFADQKFALTFLVKPSSACTIKSQLFHYFGVGGSASQYYTAQSHTLTANTWQRVTATFVVPSIKGKTIGTGSLLALRIWLQAGAGASATHNLGGAVTPIGNPGFISFRNFKLEQGEEPTSYVPHDWAMDILRTKFFYDRRNYPVGDIIGIGYAESSTLVKMPWEREKLGYRTAPALVVSDPSHFRIRRAGTTDIQPTAVQIQSGTQNTIQFIVASGLTAGECVAVRSANTGCYLAMDARL